MSEQNTDPNEILVEGLTHMVNRCKGMDNELEELRKDKERLEYLLREYNLYRFGYEERLDRDDIDEAMKEEA